MWYVVQVRTGTEESIRRQCEKQIDENVLEGCFVPYYEEQRRMRGKWTTLRKVLFPGYVFVITGEAEELYKKLKMITGLTKLLGTGREIVPISEDEQTFLRKFCGKEQVAVMSEGIIEGSQVRVTSGPLLGMEGYIRRIDRHKRKAWLEMELFGRKQMIQAGLEVVAKNWKNSL